MSLWVPLASQHRLHTWVLLYCPQLWPVSPVKLAGGSGLLLCPWRALPPRAMPIPPLGTVPPKKPSRWVLLLQGATQDPLHAPKGPLPPLGTSLSAPQGTACIPVRQ